MSVHVSVIVAVHNGANHLRTALDSVLASTWRDFELLVVDDGSTDGSPAVAASYADPRVKSIPLSHNVGVAAAREIGLSHGVGEYVWFVDADDSVTPSGMECLVTAARRSGADIVIGESEVVDGKSSAARATPARWTGSEAMEALLRGRIRGQLWDKLFSGRLIRSVEVPHSRVHSDVALVARCLAVAESVVRIDDVVYSYVVRSSSIIGSSRRRADSLRTVEQVVTSAASTTSVSDDVVAYYRARFIGLSLIRDAAAGGWSPAESAAVVQSGRDRIVWSAVCRAASDKQWRIAATLAIARVRPSLFVTVRRWARVRR